ncbi:glutamine synthetase family protein [Aestuariirhabdus sp. Z084]|uniref:glutamine synthetase family protein n=1 Tax=Aestuariirhabdus haliotis TaxID=2918751 RepID=UPI0020C0147F|nr:glutamine synthetase family protein [Aestuariirhabdus haliotis]MCL6414196.1 glutamine synthetase family protein [Aestuariirhabdus haliotis]
MQAIDSWLKENGITEVECLVADFTGIARGKIMPASKFMKERGIRLPESVALQSVTGDYVEDELYDKLVDPSEIDMRLHPDEAAMYLVPWALEPTAQIIHDTYDKQGQPTELCPRNLLKKVMALYDAKGWVPVVAPELEFYLTKPSDDPDLPLEPPVGRSGRQESGRQSFSIDATNEYDPLFEDVYDYCEAMDLDVDTLIHEEGTAQMEINFLHGSPVNLADQVFLFKRVVREAALKHNVRATFMAKPVEDQPGSSMHVHQSLLDSKTGKNIFSNEDGSMSELFLSYIAGLQKYIPYTMPLFAPNVNSYRRFLPDTSAPVNVEWGEDNRTVALRVPDSDAEARRIENRLAGADANPYLALAGTLLCGYMGIEEGLKPSKPVSGSAYHLRDRAVPVNLEHALEKMEGCEAMKARLGEKFISAYVAVKRAEYENFKRVISSWEREYLLLSV